MRKTKILATLGPASDSEDMMAQMIQAGVDAFRFNFSHGTHQQHLIAYHRARSLSRQMGRTVALIQDLQGPKIRVGQLPAGNVQLVKDHEIFLTSGSIDDSSTIIPVRYDRLEQDVRPGEIILMDDGKLRVKVLEVTEDGVRCLVLHGGTLSSHKGVNFPGTTLTTPSITEKDMEDLRFGLQLGFDAVALSFVSQAVDVVRLREAMRDSGTVRPIISKLERAACIANLSEILDVSDAVMVARGDLGVEVDIKRVPILQKKIISEANHRGIPVITATQMLESMTNGLLPTRAEAADVANAVLDGTDTLMLSGETSVGLYPVQAVLMMSDIAVEAESSYEGLDIQLWRRQRLTSSEIAEAICHTAVVAAHDLGLKSIVAITQSGRTALDIAKFRPKAAVHAFSFDENMRNFLILSKGIVPHLIERGPDLESLMDRIDDYLLETGIAMPAESVAIVLGAPVAEHKSTNTLTVHKMGKKWKPGE